METNEKYTGLSNVEVLNSRKENGFNTLDYKKNNYFLTSLLEIITEPMFILLIVASCIYFVISDFSNGLFMIAAIIFISAISLYQESKSRNAIATLKKLSQPKSKVIREGQTVEIPSEEIVLGDIILTEEGTYVPADGVILHSNDYSVNESILTGESLPVFKNEDSKNNNVFQGTIVTSGLAICRVMAIGKKTELGKIGKSLETISEEKTPLQLQINSFVKYMSLIGLIVFGIVWAINFFNSRSILDSLVKALTLAMSIIPEEIPVAFTTFLALGAWRLIKSGIIAKQIKTVETLGSTTVICVDKTGTITENTMSLAQ